MDNAEETPIPPKPAVLRRVPDRKFFSVEFPGHIENLEKAKEMIGGDRAILNASVCCPTTYNSLEALTAARTHQALGFTPL
jgi:hypothetical protein